MISFRIATQADIEWLRLLAIETFKETYAARNTEENISNYLSQSFNKDTFGIEFQKQGTIFILLIVENECIGYAKLRLSNEALADRNAIELERIYVLKAFHHQHYGKALLQKCLSFAQEQGYEAVWLGVWDENAKAIHFYQKMGFEIFGSHEFRLGAEVQNDFLMKFELVDIKI